MNFTDNEIYRIKRKRAGLTLKQIAEEINCTSPLLSMHENGHIYLSNEKLEQYKKIINDALGESQKA